MRTFTLQLTRDEVIALGRAISGEMAYLQEKPRDREWGYMNNMQTLAYLFKVIEKLPEPEELDSVEHVAQP